MQISTSRVFLTLLLSLSPKLLFSAALKMSVEPLWAFDKLRLSLSQPSWDAGSRTGSVAASASPGAQQLQLTTLRAECDDLQRPLQPKPFCNPLLPWIPPAWWRIDPRAAPKNEFFPLRLIFFPPRLIFFPPRLIFSTHFYITARSSSHKTSDFPKQGLALKYFLKSFWVFENK